MNKSLLTSSLLLVSLIVAGCTTKPVLLSRAAANPQGVDLSGHWVRRLPEGQSLGRPDAGEQMIHIPPVQTRRQRTNGQTTVRTERSKGPAVHVFIESGRSIKITQTEHSLFLSYDRSRVEEYTFGENRMISLGPIEAQRVSGWEGGVYVVETMDEKGATLTESWALSGDGSELVRVIGIVDDGKDLYSSRDVFDRT